MSTGESKSLILAVKCVCQSTLNLTRGRLVIQNYSKTGNILSVEEVNQMEPVIFPCHSKKKIIIGAKYENEQNLIPFSDKGKEIYSLSIVPGYAVPGVARHMAPG